MLSLRKADLDDRFPGLLDAVLTAEHANAPPSAASGESPPPDGDLGEVTPRTSVRAP